MSAKGKRANTRKSKIASIMLRSNRIGLSLAAVFAVAAAALVVVGVEGTRSSDDAVVAGRRTKRGGLLSFDVKLDIFGHSRRFQSPSPPPESRHVPLPPGAENEDHGAPIKDASVIRRFLSELESHRRHQASGLDRFPIIAGIIKTVRRFQLCTTPNGEQGHCRHVQHCVLPVFLKYTNAILPYACFIRGSNLGVCCPDRHFQGADGDEEAEDEADPQGARPSPGGRLTPRPGGLLSGLLKNITEVFTKPHRNAATPPVQPAAPIIATTTASPTPSRDASYTGPGTWNQQQANGQVPQTEYVKDIENAPVRFEDLVKGSPANGSPASSPVQEQQWVPAPVSPKEPAYDHERPPSDPLPPPPQTSVGAVGEGQSTDGSAIRRYETTCGLNIKSRIVGGEVANKELWSWIAALMKLDKRLNKTEQFCGGVVVSNRYIVTAAHCLPGVHPRDLTIRLGEFDFNDESNQNRRDFGVTRIIRHPDYNDTNNYADIALVKTNREIQFDRNLLPVCMPEDDTFVDKVATVLGWGVTSFGGPSSTVLMQLSLPVWSNYECQEKLTTVKIYDEFLCAGLKDRGGHDSCQGDSGGPLMVENSNEQWSLIGIVSWGFKCAQKGIPAVYTRVTRFREWIYKNAV